MRRVILYGHLGRTFGRVHHLEVETPAEAVRALSAAFGERFRGVLRRGSWHVLVGGAGLSSATECGEDVLSMHLGRQDIRFVPKAVGAKNGFFQAILGATLLVAAIYFAPPAATLYGPGMADVAVSGMGATAFSVGSWSVSYGSIALTGGMMALSGISSLLTTTPKLGHWSSLEDSDSRNSLLYNGAILTTNQGGPVPMVYGRQWVSGSLVYSGTEIEQMEGGANTTLRSKAVARMIIAVSEGEVGGLVNGAKSIKFGDTPLMADDGTYNFEGVNWTFRTGTPSQAHVPGFADVQNEYTVNTDVTHSAPVIRRVADTDADAARVIVTLRSLYQVSGSSIVSRSVDIAIDGRLDGGEWVELRTDTITGKTTSQYQRAYRVERPGAGDWDLRVRRVSEDSDSDQVGDLVQWASYVEIEDVKVSYANTAILALELDSELFGTNIPTPSVEIYGIKVRVPSNYNPATRVSTGIWNGTWAASRAWTDNPVWCLYDLLTSRRYGCGAYGLEDGNVDKWSASTVAAYCDGLVPDGYGGTEPRFRVGCVINSREPVYNVLAVFASVFRGALCWSSDLVMFAADMPAEPGHIVNQTTVVDGVHTAGGASLSTLNSVFVGLWNDPDDGCRQTPETFESPAALAKVGWKSDERVLWGVPSRGQARRALRWIYYTDWFESERITFTGGLHYFDFGPYMTALDHDPDAVGIRLGGRIVAATAGSVTLDSTVSLEEADSGPLSVLLPDLTLQAVEVASVASTEYRGRSVSVLTLAEELSAAPIPGAPWVLETRNVAPRVLRCVSREEVEPHLYEIKGFIHDPGKYDWVEQGLKLEPRETSALPRGPLPVPRNLSVTEHMRRDGSAVAPTAIVSWSPPAGDPRAVYAQVQVKRPGLDWENVGVTSGVSSDVPVSSGDHGFRVRFLTGAGVSGPWSTVATQAMLGMYAALPDVRGLTMSYVYNTPRLSWLPVDDPRQVLYEARKGESWAKGARAALTSETSMPTAGPGTYWLKAKSGVAYSASAASIVISGDDLPVNVVDGRDEAAEGWDGTRGGGIVLSGGDLVLPGGSADAAYVIAEANRVTLAAKALCAVSVTVGGYALTDGEDFYSVADVYSLADVYGGDSGYVSITPQMRLRSGTAWGDWSDFVPGQYFADGFDFRVLLSTSRSDVSVVLDAFDWRVDAPDRTWSAQGLSVPAAGLRVDYAQAFATTPALVVQTQAGQVAHISNESSSGFDLVITEGGTAVTTTANAIAKGY
ncbi:TipJ family phage tail tip protein [Desulfovibrio aminophilus]|uniref:TipJ family phage tail tip protein n=1 Tax=Desulfovibrio aminophilus TaxID=81425 RepID=UPI000412C118|nr:phage tail protein [Desulfovibrio aminophilus]